MLALMFALAAAAHAQEPPIDWRDAARCLGHVCAVRGTVAVSDPDGAAIRLYFDAQQRDVRVLLMRGWLVDWPSYDGKTIVATGKVGRFRNHIEVTVLDPRDVVIEGGDASPVAAQPTPALAPPLTPAPPSPLPTQAPSPPSALPTPAPSPPTSPAGEVEELRQRVRELEQRVRELEGR